jgi:drug/metabolite transporter (DMT)-like permease
VSAQKKLSVFLLVICTLFWGLSFIVIKESVAHFSIYSFMAIKFLLAALSLLIIFPQSIRKLDRAGLRNGILISLPLFAGTLTQAIGLTQTSASNAAFITGLSLVCLPVMKYIFYRRKMSILIVLAILVALTGLALLTLKSSLTFNSGDKWVMVCALAFAGHILLVGRYSGKTNAMALTLVQLFASGIWCLLCGLWVESRIEMPVTASIWKALLFTALLSTAFVYAVQNYAQQYLSEEKTALIFLLEPVFASLAAWYYLNEQPTLRSLAGGLLILLAIVLSEYNPAAGKKAADEKAADRKMADGKVPGEKVAGNI